jgi:hypothetical protein
MRSLGLSFVKVLEWNFDSRVIKSDGSMWGLEVPVPLDVSADIESKGVKRFICYFSPETSKHCALLSKPGVGKYILMNKQEFKVLNLHEGAIVHVRLCEDQSEYGMPMPQEMKELLVQDPVADKYFHALTPGKQRSLLYIIGKPKRTQTRIEKALIVCEYLKEAEGKMDFRAMVESFKNNRFKL